ncbi:MAG TPA: hydrolase [Bacillus sp. (in: firmicutes)]|uniref:hydrolase n=1 Tax=Bacillus litorisediminis TaxID=2922713 RepID=UPI001FAED421|nr:hydrolase [Bacillus litorisediminis]HWO75690.1 hydrolase [Bacillus sp. (in: firmicutes)]
MTNERKTYYIDLGSGEISRSRTASAWNYQIEASDEDITQLREYFDQMHSTGWQNFFRAHVPYVQYHYDRENDANDRLLKDVYQLIHDLGDEEARKQIESMGILDEKSYAESDSQDIQNDIK